MPSLARFTRLPVLALTYAVLRGAAVRGLHPATFPDSAGYQNLDLSAPIDRTWPVPLQFFLVKSDHARVLVHVLIGALAWTFLASFLGKKRKFPTLVTIATFVMGLSPQVIRYDLAILSESLTISVGVALVAATLVVADETSWRWRTLWSALFVIFSMIRPQHMILLTLVTAVILANGLWKRRLPGFGGLFLVTACIVGFVQLWANRPTSELNLYTVIVEQVLTDNTRFAWFVDHGMPSIPGMRAATSYDYAEQAPKEVLDFLQLPTGQAPPQLVRVGGMQFAHWVRNSGWSTYAKYVISHPSDTRNRITELLSPTLDPTNDRFLPLQTRTVIPRSLFFTWEVCVLLVLSGSAFALLNAQWRRSAVMMMSLLAVGAIYSAAMLTSGIEHPRHASTVAVLLRVCALAGVAELFRRDVSADAPSAVAPGA